MTDVLFITAEDVKRRMALSPDVLGVDNAINSAIKAAQHRMVSELDSVIFKTTFEDVFYLDSEHLAGLKHGGLSTMQLSSGLVRDSLVITTGDRWNDCSEPVDSSSVRVDYLKGLVYVDGDLFEGKYVKVSYSAGYEEGESLPSWLVEAILAFVPSIATFGSPTVKAGEAARLAELAAKHSMAVINPYRRTGGTFFRPLH